MATNLLAHIIALSRFDTGNNGTYFTLERIASSIDQIRFPESRKG